MASVPQSRVLASECLAEAPPAVSEEEPASVLSVNDVTAQSLLSISVLLLCLFFKSQALLQDLISANLKNGKTDDNRML